MGGGAIMRVASFFINNQTKKVNMGLDMYACSVDEEMHNGLQASYLAEDQELPESTFYWRKHSKLHQFMQDYYYECVSDGIIVEPENRQEEMPMGTFNCVPLHLPIDKIKELHDLVKTNNLPDSQGGLFFGHQFQDQAAKEEKKKDLKFCRWAKDETKNGNFVYYSCWF